MAVGAAAELVRRALDARRAGVGRGGLEGLGSDLGDQIGHDEAAAAEQDRVQGHDQPGSHGRPCSSRPAFASRCLGRGEFLGESLARPLRGRPEGARNIAVTPGPLQPNHRNFRRLLEHYHAIRRSLGRPRDPPEWTPPGRTGSEPLADIPGSVAGRVDPRWLRSQQIRSLRLTPGASARDSAPARAGPAERAGRLEIRRAKRRKDGREANTHGNDGQDHRHRPGHHQLGGRGHGGRRADRDRERRGRAHDAVGRRVHERRRARSSARSPSARPSPTRPARSTRSSASWAAARSEVPEEIGLVPYEVVEGKDGTRRRRDRRQDLSRRPRSRR